MKIEKAKKLLKQYPHIVFPWQKALEAAASTNAFSSCKWIITTAIIEYKTTLNIHFENDIIYKNSSKFHYKTMIDILTITEPEYPWNTI